MLALDVHLKSTLAPSAVTCATGKWLICSACWLRGRMHAQLQAASQLQPPPHAQLLTSPTAAACSAATGAQAGGQGYRFS